MIIWCEKCNVKPVGKHKAKCSFCSKGEHPVCNDCYNEGVEDGTIKPLNQKKGIIARIFG